MNNIIELDGEKENKWVETYGKVNGWFLCKKMGLPSFDKMYIITDYIDEKDSFLNEVMGDQCVICRPDSPWGQAYKLPRGRNIGIMQINDFLTEIRQSVEKGVLLICMGVCNNQKGVNILRANIDGGVFAVFEEDKVVIEHVGKGFDVGDISRGKTVHNRMIIPNAFISEKPEKIFFEIKEYFPENFFTISDTDYRISKENRKKELKYGLLERCVDPVWEKVSEVPQTFSLELFRKLYYECIEKVFYLGHTIRRPFGLMINIYDRQLCVFEVWQKKRSMSFH